MRINDAIWDELEAENRTLKTRIAELEAENKSQVEKTIEARQETHLHIIQKRQAEAALAELEQCPDQNEYPYSNLRVRAEEGSGEDCPECGKWMYGAECLSRGHKHPDSAEEGEG